MITKEETEKVISKRKGNKFSSDDDITSEFIKHSKCKMLVVHVNLFNVIFDTGNAIVSGSPEILYIYTKIKVA